jgi:hypothetical protein
MALVAHPLTRHRNTRKQTHLAYNPGVHTKLETIPLLRSHTKLPTRDKT